MAKVVTQPSPKVLACRANGRKGGLARAKNKTKKQMADWSSKGGKRTKEIYGVEIFTFINKKRKTKGRYNTPKKVKA